MSKPILQHNILSDLDSIERRISAIERSLQTQPLNARVGRNTTQSMGNNNEDPITFNIVRFDNGGFWNSGSPTRLTAPASGLYLIGGNIQFAHNTSGRRILRILINGSNYIADQRSNATAASSDLALNVNTIYPLSAGNYVELRAFQDSGGSLNVLAADFTPEFWITFISN